MKRHSAPHTAGAGLPHSAAGPEESTLQRIVGQLATPDPHIPRPGTAGIDPEALARITELFRSVVFDGYFDRRPVEQRLGELTRLLADQTARARAAFALGGTTRPETQPFPAERPTAADDTARQTVSAPKALSFPTERPTADSTARQACPPPEAARYGDETARRLLEALPELRRRLGTDVRAVFDGDPAAGSFEEVILCYPALVALTHYRLAHALWEFGVPILPRMITERAHSATGIDIHPGASIGDSFSIDHGTGVVIGETCIIGSHVRLYQGVTLGAKSFKFDAEGHILREPRHPILEDRVVVYSNSSILGRVRIGHDSVIGGNVWQTTDLPPHSRVVQGRASISTYENGGGI